MTPPAGYVELERVLRAFECGDGDHALAEQLDRIEQQFGVAQDADEPVWTPPEQAQRVQQILLAYLGTLFAGAALVDLQADLEEVFPSAGYLSRSPAAPDDVAFERWVRGLLSGPARLGAYRDAPRHEIERVTYEEIDG